MSPLGRRSEARVRLRGDRAYSADFLRVAAMVFTGPRRLPGRELSLHVNVNNVALWRSYVVVSGLSRAVCAALSTHFGQRRAHTVQVFQVRGWSKSKGTGRPFVAA